MTVRSHYGKQNLRFYQKPSRVDNHHFKQQAAYLFRAQLRNAKKTQGQRSLVNNNFLSFYLQSFCLASQLHSKPALQSQAAIGSVLSADYPKNTHALQSPIKRNQSLALALLYGLVFNCLFQEINALQNNIPWQSSTADLQQAKSVQNFKKLQLQRYLFIGFMRLVLVGFFITGIAAVKRLYTIIKKNYLRKQQGAEDKLEHLLNILPKPINSAWVKIISRSAISFQLIAYTADLTKIALKTKGKKHTIEVKKKIYFENLIAALHRLHFKTYYHEDKLTVSYKVNFKHIADIDKLFEIELLTIKKILQKNKHISVAKAITATEHMRAKPDQALQIIAIKKSWAEYQQLAEQFALLITALTKRIDYVKQRNVKDSLRKCAESIRELLSRLTIDLQAMEDDLLVQIKKLDSGNFLNQDIDQLYSSVTFALQQKTNAITTLYNKEKELIVKASRVNINLNNELMLASAADISLHKSKKHNAPFNGGWADKKPHDDAIDQAVGPIVDKKKNKVLTELDKETIQDIKYLFSKIVGDDQYSFSFLQATKVKGDCYRLQYSLLAQPMLGGEDAKFKRVPSDDLFGIIKQALDCVNEKLMKIKINRNNKHLFEIFINLNVLDEKRQLFKFDAFASLYEPLHATFVHILDSYHSQAVNVNENNNNNINLLEKKNNNLVLIKHANIQQSNISYHLKILKEQVFDLDKEYKDQAEMQFVCLCHSLNLLTLLTKQVLFLEGDAAGKWAILINSLKASFFNVYQKLPWFVFYEHMKMVIDVLAIEWSKSENRFTDFNVMRFLKVILQQLKLELNHATTLQKNNIERYKQDLQQIFMADLSQDIKQTAVVMVCLLIYDDLKRQLNWHPNFFNQPLQLISYAAYQKVKYLSEIFNESRFEKFFPELMTELFKQVADINQFLIEEPVANVVALRQ